MIVALFVCRPVGGKVCFVAIFNRNPLVEPALLKQFVSQVPFAEIASAIALVREHFRLQTALTVQTVS
jgi:hypothetical protein